MTDSSQFAAIPRLAWLALVAGPAAYLAAGRQRRAAVVGVLWLGALLAYAYVPYLQTFLALDTGGESAREVTDTALRAAEAWVRSAPEWAPGGWWVVLVGNLACAVDLWRLLRR